MAKNTVIEVDNVSMEFNLNKERTDSLKEFIIKFINAAAKDVVPSIFVSLNAVKIPP